jgi:hypothetical protein
MISALPTSRRRRPIRYSAVVDFGGFNRAQE